MIMNNREIFSAEIIDIGQEAENFLTENMAILFDHTAPEELFNYCFIIKIKQFNDNLNVGDQLRISENCFDIAFVGSEANDNLRELGHIALFFNRDSSDALPGSVFVNGKNNPNFEIGEKISVSRKGE